MQIVEKVAASQSSTSSVDKSGNLDGSITALPFFAPNSWKRASASGSSTNSFEGKGTTESANTFTGTITATVKVNGPTGVEMEALTAASVAALTVYDMCKAIDRGMTISDVRLVHKSGGKSGVYEAS